MYPIDGKVEMHMESLDKYSGHIFFNHAVQLLCYIDHQMSTHLTIKWVKGKLSVSPSLVLVINIGVLQNKALIYYTHLLDSLLQKSSGKHTFIHHSYFTLS